MTDTQFVCLDALRKDNAFFSRPTVSDCRLDANDASSFVSTSPSAVTLIRHEHLPPRNVRYDGVPYLVENVDADVFLCSDGLIFIKRSKWSQNACVNLLCSDAFASSAPQTRRQLSVSIFSDVFQRLPDARFFFECTGNGGLFIAVSNSRPRVAFWVECFDDAVPWASSDEDVDDSEESNSSSGRGSENNDDDTLWGRHLVTINKVPAGRDGAAAEFFLANPLASLALSDEEAVRHIVDLLVQNVDVENTAVILHSAAKQDTS